MSLFAAISVLSYDGLDRGLRMTLEELGAEARLSQVGSLEDVRYA